MTAHGDPARPDSTTQSVVPPVSMAASCVPLQNPLGTLTFISDRHWASRPHRSPGLQVHRCLLCTASGQAERHLAVPFSGVKPGSETNRALPTSEWQSPGQSQSPS